MWGQSLGQQFQPTAQNQEKWINVAFLMIRAGVDGMFRRWESDHKKKMKQRSSIKVAQTERMVETPRIGTAQAASCFIVYLSKN